MVQNLLFSLRSIASFENSSQVDDQLKAMQCHDCRVCQELAFSGKGRRDAASRKMTARGLHPKIEMTQEKNSRFFLYFHRAALVLYDLHREGFRELPLILIRFKGHELDLREPIDSE